MISAPLDAVLSHWSKLLEGVSASPLEFYASVEQEMRRREIPDIQTERVEWAETGPFSAKRIYLRVSRGRHVFDICAAPFGGGFFVSSWLAKAELSGGVIALVMLPIVLLILASISLRIFGILLGIPFILIGWPIGFWVAAQFLTSEKPGWDDPLVAMPFLGRFYERFFRPETYYSIDTALMFQQSVHNAVLETVDQITSAKGVKGLSELERARTMRGLLRP